MFHGPIVNMYMLAMVGVKGRTNCLNFSMGTHGYPGGNEGQKKLLF